jgi:hypothetical protein
MLKKGQVEEAERVTRLLHGARPGASLTDEEELWVREEFYQMRKQVELEQTDPFRWMELWTRKSYRRRMFIAIFQYAAMQSTGILVINNYSILLYNALGYTGGTALVLNACWTSLSVPFNVLNSIVIDRIGRRPVFLFSLSGVLGKFSATRLNAA